MTALLILYSTTIATALSAFAETGMTFKKAFSARYRVYRTTAPAKPQFEGGLAASGNWLRLENERLSPRMVLLFDLQNRKSFTFWPEKKVYLVSDNKNGQFMATNLVDPCKSAQDAGGTCKRIGPRTRNGRKTDEYEIRFPGKGVIRAYQDRELKTPIRVESPDGTVNEMTRLSVTPQASDLFKVPSSYRRISQQEALLIYSRAD